MFNSIPGRRGRVKWRFRLIFPFLQVLPFILSCIFKNKLHYFFYIQILFSFLLQYFQPLEYMKTYKIEQDSYAHCLQQQRVHEEMTNHHSIFIKTTSKVFFPQEDSYFYLFFIYFPLSPVKEIAYVCR